MQNGAEHMRKARYISVFLAVGCAILVLVFVRGEYLDEAANAEFGEKCKQLEVIGKTREFVFREFGKPFSIRTNEYSDEVLLYYPYWGICLYPSGCGFLIDGKTGIVKAWQIGSD